MPLDTHEFGGRENVQVFPATVTDAVTSTPFLTFPYGSFFDVFGIFVRKAFEQHDDPEMRPMCNQSGRMFAQDGNFGIFQSSNN